jgi:hypothetical protein
MFLLKKGRRSGGCGEKKEDSKEELLLSLLLSCLVYLLLMGYSSGYVRRPSCNCVLRCDWGGGGAKEEKN